MSNVEIAESVRTRARWTMILLGLGGVLLVVAGVSMRLLAQPSGGWFAYMPDDSSVISESVDSIGYTVDTSTGGGMLSGVLVLVGLALLLVGLIAWGVRLGREASRV